MCTMCTKGKQTQSLNMMILITIMFATCSHYLGSRGLVSGRRHDCHQFKCLRDKSLGRSKAMLNQKILKLRGSEMLLITHYLRRYFLKKVNFEKGQNTVNIKLYCNVARILNQACPSVFKGKTRVVESRPCCLDFLVSLNRCCCSRVIEENLHTFIIPYPLSSYSLD